MKYIEAPSRPPMGKYDLETSIFIAGSITGARNWQKDILKIPVGSEKITILDCYNAFNPRQENFDVNDPDVEKEQITWEYDAIHKCKYILFWFSHETLAPITLLELGSALNTHNPDCIFIGVHPEYKRKNDVIIQTALRNKKLSEKIVFNLEDLAKIVVQENRGRFKTFLNKKNEH